MFQMNEKPRPQLSPDITRQLRQTNQAINKAKERIRSITPLCPDGSGEEGVFDEEASKRNGGVAIYRTESGKYFHWVDSLQKGRVLEPELHDFK